MHLLPLLAWNREKSDRQPLNTKSQGRCRQEETASHKEIDTHSTAGQRKQQKASAWQTFTLISVTFR